MKKYILFLMVPLFHGCTKVSVNSEFSRLQKKTTESTESSIIFDNVLHTAIVDIPVIKNKSRDGLSKNEAVSVALLNNPELQADFQNLGIAKADLVQASLYSNPNINSVFRFPTRTRGSGSAQVNIESVAAVRLSDLWQVPLSQNVAEDLLEVVSFRIFAAILTTIVETKMAYISCLAAELQLQNTKYLLEVAHELRDEIYYRQLYGYTTDFDKNIVDAKLGILETKFEQYKADLAQTYIHLKK